ncbi:ABC transporter permease [Phytoactinopolyspora halotolerans]|uniref:FtsX-like permease family protein n=1 Tax=Phytoactinopolyspora halotolerans TaxID=1981512 RepID=A0A6L9S5A8_9ACTN|nr:FtsX-like permease family protein [Phytoactinopolyspora halotolerans]NED99930.1 FtsX-like permease family protein [Phytoactinopolyspora halotolerans]
MTAVAYWFRLDARRRWRSLLVLTLLIAVAAGTVMTAGAGARRGSSAVDRLLAETMPATVRVEPNRPGFDWDAVRALPEVAALGVIAYSGFEIDGEPAGDSLALPPVDTGMLRTVERPVVLEGRAADPSRADEVVVTPAFERTRGTGVGDTVTLGLYTPGQIDVVQGPDTAYASTDDGVLGLYTPEQLQAALAAGWDINETAPAAGPVIEATVVGVVRSPWFGDRLHGAGYVIPSAGLYQQFTAHFSGARDLAGTGALVRLHGGAAAIPKFREHLAQVAGQSDIVVVNQASWASTTREVTGFEATALFVFAVVSAVAAVFLVGVAVARHAAVTVTELTFMRAVGMTPGQARSAAIIGPACAGVAGAALGAAASILASRWFPIGTASVVEPAPGVDVDVAVLAAGLAGVPFLVISGAVAASAFASRSTERHASARRSTMAAAASAAGLPVPVVAGTRFAFEPGRGRRAVPVRPALLGAVAGVTGVLAALTFSAAVHDAATNPARVGVLHGAEAYVGFNDFAFVETSADAVFTALAETPGVTGVQDVVGNVAEAGAESGTEQLVVMSPVPLGAPAEQIITEGRPPAGPAEAMLGLRTVDALGAGVGDTITLTGTSGTTDLTVVGVGGDAVDTSVVTTRAAYETLFGERFQFHMGEVGFEPGIDFETMLPRLRDALTAVPGASPDTVGIIPPEFDDPAGLRFMRPLPLFLAGFVVVLALGSVGYALGAAVRRRGPEIAVLRALGMTPGQSRRVVITQAIVLTLAGLAVGVPVGLAVGRTVWRSVADAMYIHYVPPAAVWALVLVAPVALLVAVLLAAVPGRCASSLRIASVLRAE